MKGRSYITFTNTNVIRNNVERDANVTGLDFSLYDKQNVFNIKGFGHYSKIFSANSYDGYNTSLKLGKVSGKVLYSLQNSIISVNYNPTDLGYLPTANLHTNAAAVSYNQITPVKNFLSYSYTFSALHRRLYKPGRFSDLTLDVTGFWYLKNFWDISLTAAYLPDQHDYFVLEQHRLKNMHAGPSMAT